MTDQLIIAARELSSMLLPTIGLIVLVILGVLLIKVIKLIDAVINTVNRTHTTIDLVDKSIEKVQQPLDTVVKLSGTVDKVHDAGVKMVSDSAEFLSQNKEAIKNKVHETVSKVKKEKPVKVPSPEDIIGGK